MRNWKVIMMVLCLALCLPGLFGMAEAKGGKDMVKEKTAYVTRCSYSSSGSSTGGHEHIELTRLSDTEASYKISSKDWHSSPERVVEQQQRLAQFAGTCGGKESFRKRVQRNGSAGPGI